MSESATAINLGLTIVDADQDDDALDALARQLREELTELGVESAELEKGAAAPSGTKSAEAVTLGALAISVLPVMIPKLIEFLQAWATRGEGRTVKVKAQVADRMVELEYSPKAMSQAELKSLVDTLTGSLSEKPTAT